MEQRRGLLSMIQMNKVAAIEARWEAAGPALV
jgi:hypothetical protein